MATAGHVDHGKSTLVRALTGTDPDRLAEEKRRGLTVDLGFAATGLPDGRAVGFVDVPGHRRFLANTLAGIATAPAVLFTVAADRGWQPQSAEHLAAVEAFGIRTGIVVVTRADLADPAPAAADARARVAGTTLRDAPAVPVSARTGAGLDVLRRHLAALADSVPAPDPHAPVRLWLDRAFTVRGAGTVVTGTLTAGALAVGDILEVAPEGRQVTVRGLQCFGAARDGVRAPARVAVNLRRVSADAVGRGQALVTPGRWRRTDTVDVRLADPADPSEADGPGRPGAADARALPGEPLVHCGTALTGARVRPLGGPYARLRLHTPLDLHIGDRLLLRDPGSRRLTGARVLDVAPPRLTRRGAAAARVRALAVLPADGRDPAVHLGLRGLVRAGELAAAGLPHPPGAVRAGEWLLDPAHAERLRAALRAEVDAHGRARPADPGLPLAAAAHRLGLPAPDLVPALAAPPAPAGTPAPVPGGPEQPSPDLVVRDGRVFGAGDETLPEALAAVARRLEEAGRDAGSAFHAPTRPELDALGVTPQALAALVRHGVLERHGTGTGAVHLPGGSARRAAAALRDAAPRPFTVGDCCRILAVSRRVAIPLLEHLDGAGLTRRDADGRRLVVDGTAAAEGP
ncbi:selenocysteine-specific translation elongation factor [Streptomyces sp. RKND-216]|uniref:selenocysteine-specific translation elongation factor n=1 Tax=Streptomyces sp. RKND-216 TaxID=2562581 RepID=UPI001FFB376E|nr:selenocysteine-specific translation elongation factor [Streptomyces sp. RKND-216]